MPAKAHRLPAGVRPRSYEIRLRASPDQPRFEGHVRIELELAQPMQAVELHARGLEFRSVAAEQGGRVEGRAELHADTESATLHFPKALKAGHATLDLSYDAPVSQGMTGLYLSKDGPEQCLVTQCEATDARAVFPCFDEPAFKATLKWIVTAPKGLTVLANGPLASRSDAEGWTTWEFAPTPPVSCYLAAVAIGKFVSTPEVKVGEVPYNVWAMEGKAQLGMAARDAAAKMAPWYEGYFGVPYRFGKYDQLAVPSFSFGAMENAGLVVFRASALLMDPKTASWRDQRRITLVVAHEFAHQWFGNDVTMAWWDDLWLNESFAEWIAHRCVDALWPQHEVWIDFQGRSNGALSTDALRASHPIYQPVETPAEAAELFDAITYGKGSATLRMLEGFLGEDSFRVGLRAYMEEFGGANAQGKDLWRHLSKASAQPVEQLMHGWVAQAGHPVVRATLQGSKLRLRQDRFLSMPGASAGEQKWDVPIVLRYEDQAGVHTVRHLLREREETVAIDVHGKLAWCLANAGDVGFYRTDPDDALFEGLRASVAKLTPAERVGFLRDQWGLLRNGTRPPARLFGLIGAMVPRETHYAVVETAAEIAREAERWLELQGEAQPLERYRGWVRGVFAPALQAVGADAKAGEPPATGVLRASAYRALAGIARDPRAVEDAIQLAGRERRDASTVDANLAGTVVGLAAQFGGAARFDEHVKAYAARRDAKRPPQESDRYLGSFVAFRPPELVTRTLRLLDDGTVPKQSVGPLLVGMLREPHAQAKAWAHVQQRWKDLRQQLGDSWAANLVEASGGLPPARRGEIEAFLDAHARDLVQSSARAKGLLEERAALFDQVVPSVAAWARNASRGS